MCAAAASDGRIELMQAGHLGVRDMASARFTGRPTLAA